MKKVQKNEKSSKKNGKKSVDKKGVIECIIIKSSVEED